MITQMKSVWKNY